MRRIRLAKSIHLVLILIVVLNMVLAFSLFSSISNADDVFSQECYTQEIKEKNMEGPEGTENETDKVTIENFAVVPRDNEIELFWIISKNDDEDISISHYNITKDGEHLEKIDYNINSYLDEDVKNTENYTYQIEVIDEEGNVLATDESYGSPESYWWIGVSALVNIIALLVIVFIIFKKRR